MADIKTIYEVSKHISLLAEVISANNFNVTDIKKLMEFNDEIVNRNIQIIKELFNDGEPQEPQEPQELKPQTELPANAVETEYRGLYVTTHGKVYDENGLQLLAHENSSGKPFITYKSIQIQVDRLVMGTFSKTKNSEVLTVKHLDGNRYNNDLNNLKWDKRPGKTSLRVDDIVELSKFIRDNSNMAMTAIAKKFANIMSFNSVRAIYQKIRYREISDKYFYNDNGEIIPVITREIDK